MVEWQQILIGALVAGGMSIATGVITWWITRSRERLDETRRLQLNLLTQLIANRYDLAGEQFLQALNGCAVVFADSLRVRNALREFHDEVTKQNRSTKRIETTLLSLIRSMIEYLDLQIHDLPDDFLLKPFNTLKKIHE